MRNKRSVTHAQAQKRAVDAFWNAAYAADQQGKSIELLRNVLTESEQMMLGRRLAIAQALLLGTTRNEIISLLRVSPNTVWKVHRWLTEQIPEYGAVLEKTRQESEARTSTRKKIRPWYQKDDGMPFVRLRKKYPLHFLIFNITADLLEKRRRK
jgi:uncharacterized protein YerC